MILLRQYVFGDDFRFLLKAFIFLNILYRDGENVIAFLLRKPSNQLNYCSINDVDLNSTFS